MPERLTNEHGESPLTFKEMRDRWKHLSDGECLYFRVTATNVPQHVYMRVYNEHDRLLGDVMSDTTHAMRRVYNGFLDDLLAAFPEQTHVTEAQLSFRSVPAHVYEQRGNEGSDELTARISELEQQLVHARGEAARATEEAAQLRAETERLEHELQALRDATLFSGLADLVEHGADTSEQLEEGVRVDTLGVRRTFRFTPEFRTLMNRYVTPDGQTFRSIARQDATIPGIKAAHDTLMKLAHGLMQDRTVDGAGESGPPEGWAGKENPEDLTSADWRNRLPPGFNIRLLRTPLRGLPPGATLEDAHREVTVPTVELTFNIDARNRDRRVPSTTRGIGPAVTEAATIIGQIYKMMDSREAPILWQAFAELGVQRIRFTVVKDKQPLVFIETPIIPREEIERILEHAGLIDRRDDA